jgi:hypothetical protein
LEELLQQKSKFEMIFRILIIFIISYLTVNSYIIIHLLDHFNLVDRFIETFNNNFTMFICLFAVLISNALLYFFSRKMVFINFMFSHIGLCLLILCYLCFCLEKTNLNIVETYNLYSLSINYICGSFISFIFFMLIDFVNKKSNEVVKYILLLVIIVLYIVSPIDYLIKNLFVISVFLITSNSYKYNHI